MTKEPEDRQMNPNPTNVQQQQGGKPGQTGQQQQSNTGTGQQGNTGTGKPAQPEHQGAKR